MRQLGRRRSRRSSCCWPGARRARRHPSRRPRAAPRTPAPTTLETYDADGVAVSRAPFCDRVSPTGIEHALGPAAASHRELRQRRPDPAARRHPRPSPTSTAASGRPRTGRRPGMGVRPAGEPGPGRAPGRRGAVGAAARARGRDSSGRPSVAARCRTDEGVERSWRGLFGDAWLVCTLAGRAAPPDATAQRDQRVVRVGPRGRPRLTRSIGSSGGRRPSARREVEPRHDLGGDQRPGARAGSTTIPASSAVQRLEGVELRLQQRRRHEVLPAAHPLQHHPLVAVEVHEERVLAAAAQDVAVACAAAPSTSSGWAGRPRRARGSRRRATPATGAGPRR